MSSQPTTRPTRIKDITGQRFGMLEVLGIAPERSNSGRVRFTCRCDCGVVKDIMGTNLKRGLSQSCGCQVIVAAHTPKPQNWRHGYANTWVHSVWFKMIDRCHNPECPNYPDYGGRGIRVCGRWRESIAAFHEDMGDRPGPDYSINRIDNNQHYEKSNCEWSTAKEQARNRRSSRWIEFRGETKTLAEWSEITGLHYSAIAGRLRLGWTVEDALTVESGRSARKKSANERPTDDADPDLGGTVPGGPRVDLSRRPKPLTQGYFDQFFDGV